MRIVRDEKMLISALRSGNEQGQHHTERSRSNPIKRAQAQGPCIRCGQSAHSQAKCPAINSDCSYSKKPGHWLAVCQKRLRNLKFLDVEIDPNMCIFLKNESKNLTFQGSTLFAQAVILLLVTSGGRLSQCWVSSGLTRALGATR